MSGATEQYFGLRHSPRLGTPRCATRMMSDSLTALRSVTDTRSDSPAARRDEPRIGILSLSVDRWGARWNSRHQLLTRLARQFPVVWVNPAPDWRAALRTGRVWSRERTIDALFRARLARARASLQRRGCTHIVLYVWHMYYAGAVSAVRSDLSVYHIYDEYSHSEHEVP